MEGEQITRCLMSAEQQQEHKPMPKETRSTMIRAGVVMVTGLAFTMGLVVGLLLHLPVVSPPLGQHNTAVRGSVLRAARDTHRAREPRDPPSEPSANTALRDSHTNFTALQDVPHSKRSANSSPTKDNILVGVDVEGKPQNKHAAHRSNDALHSVTSLQARIKLAADSINALRNTQDDTFMPRPGQSGSDSNSASNGPRRTKSQKGIGSNDKEQSDRNKMPSSGRQKMSDGDSEAVASTGGNGAGMLKMLSDYIEGGIFWSEKLEAVAPVGVTDAEAAAWRRQVSSSRVVKMEEGCGRMQNRLLTLSDGTKVCARYRINDDQTQGEVYSYYLAKLLGINNVPTPLLAVADTQADQWQGIASNIISAQWNSRKLVILTPWLNGLSPTYIPRELRQDQPKLHPTQALLKNRTLADFKDLLQWSDLIIFDYLTGNVDRVVNNMFNKQWNSEMMDNPAHNLEKSKETGKLVFLDNESGLFHSYRLLDKYQGYHEKLLGSLCVFRRSTVEAVKSAFLQESVGDMVQELLQGSDPLHHRLAPMPYTNSQTLHERLADVYNQITKCQAMYT